jgi:hypothetical protein
MKREIQLALSTVVVVTVAIAGSAFGLNHYTARQSRRESAAESIPFTRSVIKVHTDHGVITIPGRADSWDAAEHAVFIADSIADMQLVNTEIPWRLSVE